VIIAITLTPARHKLHAISDPRLQIVGCSADALTQPSYSPGFRE